MRQSLLIQKFMVTDLLDYVCTPPAYGMQVAGLVLYFVVEFLVVGKLAVSVTLFFS